VGHEVNEERIIHQIRQINSRIYELKERRDATIVTSELNKIDKTMRKLYKQKDKLDRKLNQSDSEETEFSSSELENVEDEDQVF